MTVLVTGATGSIGREVLTRLLHDGIDTRASTRDPSTASFPPGVDVRPVDLARASTLRDALDGVEAVYLFPAFEQPDQIAGAFEGSSVQRIVLLSSISTSLPDAESQFNASRFLRLERALEATAIPCTFLRAGEFAGNIRFYAPGITEGKVRIPFADSVHLPIDERDIAEVAVIGLASDALVGLKPRLTGWEPLTLRAEIDTVGAAIGRAIDISELPEQDALTAFAPDAPRPLIEAMLAIWKSTLDVSPVPSDDFQRITGRAPRRFADWARDHAAEFH